MAKKTLTKQVEDLREKLIASENNQEILSEALTVLEQQLTEQGWISLFGGGGKELSKSALDTLYDLSRMYWMKNPLIRRAVEVQALYVFGQGMNIEGDHRVVDEVVQTFLEDKRNYTSLTGHQAWIQNERDLALSGNLFFAFFTNPTTGRVIVRNIPLYEIMDVIANPEDKNEPWFYSRGYMVNEFNESSGLVTQKSMVEYYPDWRYNPKDRPKTIGGKEVKWDIPIYHVKTNCLPDMKFGISEVYSAIDWSAAYKKFLENWSKLVEAYARFAFSLTTKGGAAAVAAAKAKIESKLARTDPNAEEVETTYKQLPVATVFTSGEGVRLDTIRTQGATTGADDARRLLLMVASASGIPEQILAGDPSTGNLATAKAMERPLELQFMNRQQLWVSVWEDIIEYVLDQSIKAPEGSLEGSIDTDEYTGEEIYTLTMKDEKGEVPKSVSVTFPPILEHDVYETIQALISATTLDGKPFAGTIDLKTVAGEIYKALRIENPEELLDKLFPDDTPIFPTPPAPAFPQFGAMESARKARVQIKQNLEMAVTEILADGVLRALEHEEE